MWPCPLKNEGKYMHRGIKIGPNARGYCLLDTPFSNGGRVEVSALPRWKCIEFSTCILVCLLDAEANLSHP